VPKGDLSPARIAVIAGFALSCFSLLLFLWIAFGGTSPLKPKGYRVQASFTDAATLAIQADVRISGVSVGKVVEKRRDPAGNRTLATIELEPDFVSLWRDW
jgi:phospholipid/cholesterol/gamma-HCH transport system substrate-binding protein